MTNTKFSFPIPGIQPTDEIKHIQKPLFKFFVISGLFAIRINQGGARIKDRYGERYIKFAYWQILGQPIENKGISDLMGICKCGHVFIFECKLPGKKPTDTQALFLNSFDGFDVTKDVVYSIDHGMEIINNHLEVCNANR